MNILIVKLGAIGDIVHTLPSLAALRRGLPDARISWAVERGAGAKILEGAPGLNDLIELDLRGWRKSLTNLETQTEIRRAMWKLRNQKFDLSLDFQGLMKSAMVARLARIPRRIGFVKEALREPASAMLLTERVAADDRGHVIEKNLQLVRHLGCEPTERFEFPIVLGEEDQEFAKEKANRWDGKFAILNPGGGWPTKLWRPEGFAAIADRLFEEFGVYSAVTFGPGEEELAEQVAARSKTGAAIGLASTLKQFFALARQASLFVGGDTGPMHLAAAAGTPIVAIFGPTSSRRNGPFHQNDLVVELNDLDCRVDCYRRQCSHISCMKIEPDQVWRAVVNRLQRRAPTTVGSDGAQG